MVAFVTPIYSLFLNIGPILPLCGSILLILWMERGSCNGIETNYCMSPENFIPARKVRGSSAEAPRKVRGRPEGHTGPMAFRAEILSSRTSRTTSLMQN